jgi:threonine aldolase
MSNGARWIDLRSDTVTRPTPAMRAVMADAEVGDDVYGEDPEVNALEAEVAALFHHEAALFVPTGTMGNQIGVSLLVERGDELLCDTDAHIVTYERGAAAALFGVSTRTVTSVRGVCDVESFAAQIRVDDGHTTPTAALAVENTHNRGGGTVQPIEVLRGLRKVADAAGVAMHCDGARIWNAHVATGVPLSDYGSLFDTLSVCLSKGLGAPVGSVLVSTVDRIRQARVLRKRLGGGTRQAGILAAAGRYAIREHLSRLADDHARARQLAEALHERGVVDPSTVDTNIVLLDVPGRALRLAHAARDSGVLISTAGPDRVRLVTHLDVDDGDCARAADVLGRLLTAA